MDTCTSGRSIASIAFKGLVSQIKCFSLNGCLWVLGREAVLVLVPLGYHGHLPMHPFIVFNGSSGTNLEFSWDPADLQGRPAFSPPATFCRREWCCRCFPGTGRRPCLYYKRTRHADPNQQPGERWERTPRRRLNLQTPTTALGRCQGLGSSTVWVLELWELHWWLDILWAR